MPFAAKWGDAARQAVARAATDPERPSARAIHAGLVAGAVDGIAPEDVPPLATVRDWVTEARRQARKALGGAAEHDGLDHLAGQLLGKLERQAVRARTPEDIAAIARAAREISTLRRELARGAKPRADPAAAPDPPEDAATTFLREMADGAPAPRDA